MMLRNFLGFDRSERTQANMERYKSSLDALIAGLFQQFLSPVQTRCGCSGGADLPGINGLVPLLVSKLCLDIGRQRHLAKALQHFQENTFVVELHHPVSVIQDLRHSCRQLSVSENDLITGLHLPARLAKAFPLLISQVTEQQHFHRAAGGPMAQQSGRQNPGVIHHQAVARLQIIQNIIKMPVAHLAALPVQHQEPGGVPLQQRGLSDQFFRQFIPKIMCFHLSSLVSLKASLV